MQSVAQAWLVFDLSNSAFYLGLDGFVNTIPIAFFAFWGGVVADRLDRHKALIVTQWIMLVLALVLAGLAQAGVLRVWHIILLSFFTGLNQAFAWPLYQTVMVNMARREHLSNAIALNSTQFNLARMIGPVVGAFALSHLGASGCFYANAVSFLAVIGVLYWVKSPATRTPSDLPHGSFMESFVEGLRYMGRTPLMFWMLLTLAASSILGVPMVTLLPVYARDILQIGPSGFGILIGVFGAGAVVGGLRIAFLGEFPDQARHVLNHVLMFVAVLLVFAVSRSVPLSLVCLFVAGYTLVSYAAVINSIVQSQAPDALRGRALSGFVFAFGGCMPFGNLLAGWLAHLLGAPITLLVQGAILGLFVLYVRFLKFPLSFR